MGSATKDRLMKTAAAHPLGHTALPRASGTVRAHLASPYPWVGGWIKIPICRIPIWPFCCRSSSFQPAQSMNVRSPQMFSSPQKRKCLEGQRDTLNTHKTPQTQQAQMGGVDSHSTTWQGPAKDMLCGGGVAFVLLKTLCLSHASESGLGATVAQVLRKGMLELSQSELTLLRHRLQWDSLSLLSWEMQIIPPNTWSCSWWVIKRPIKTLSTGYTV